LLKRFEQRDKRGSPPTVAPPAEAIQSLHYHEEHRSETHAFRFCQFKATSGVDI
jgi:hypothetical protein